MLGKQSLHLDEIRERPGETVEPRHHHDVDALGPNVLEQPLDFRAVQILARRCLLPIHGDDLVAGPFCRSDVSQARFLVVQRALLPFGLEVRGHPAVDADSGVAR
ncbi:MAG: hypothetical protein V3V08_07120 [Nannocystaceae bacterium]